MTTLAGTNGTSTEMTGQQRSTAEVSFNAVDVQSISLPATYETYRTMRKHPTIALGRALHMAPIIIGEWSITSDEEVPDEVVEFITKQLLYIREPFVKSMMEGTIDFGWSPFEIIFETTPDDSGALRVGLQKIKPLLQDITEILVVTKTGAFAGFRQTDPITQKEIDIPVEQTFLFSRAVEGTYWYGEPLLENVRLDYTRWVNTTDASQRHYTRTAGAIYKILYPVGSTLYNGTETDNDTIAEAIADSLQSSGVLKIPKKSMDPVTKVVGENNDDEAWEIEVIESSSNHGAMYTDGLRYLDSLLMRGVMVPERVATEGQHGTKAESAEHADAAIASGEVVNRDIARMVTWHIVDRLLALNWPEYVGKVRVSASPLVDEDRAFIRKLYMEVLKNPNTSFEEMMTIDTDAVKDQLGIPKDDSLTETVGEQDSDDTEDPIIEDPEVDDDADDEGDED